MKPIPKYFYKLSAYDQDTWLSLRLQEIHKEEDHIRQMLKTVRGGFHYEQKEIDRPDLLDMKAEPENNTNV